MADRPFTKDHALFLVIFYLFTHLMSVQPGGACGLGTWAQFYLCVLDARSDLMESVS